MSEQVSFNKGDLDYILKLNDLGAQATGLTDVINQVVGFRNEVAEYAQKQERLAFGDVSDRLQLIEGSVLTVTTAKTDAEAAKADAETAKADAETAYSNTVLKVGDAVDAKTDAEIARGAAQTAQTDAETARDEAQNWASLPEDQQVVTGLYSARHYAAKAEAAKTAAEAAAAQADGVSKAGDTMTGTLNVPDLNVTDGPLFLGGLTGYEGGELRFEGGPSDPDPNLWIFDRYNDSVRLFKVGSPISLRIFDDRTEITGAADDVLHVCKPDGSTTANRVDFYTGATRTAAVGVDNSDNVFLHRVFTNKVASLRTDGMLIESSHGYLIAGPANTTWCHFNTDRSAFYFNKGLQAVDLLKVYGSNTYLNATAGYIDGNLIHHGGNTEKQWIGVGDGYTLNAYERVYVWSPSASTVHIPATIVSRQTFEILNATGGDTVILTVACPHVIRRGSFQTTAGDSIELRPGERLKLLALSTSELRVI